MAAVASTSSTTAPLARRDELETLTLDHILSDLASLPSNHPLLSLASTSAGPSSSSPHLTNHLPDFERGDFTNAHARKTRKDYVELSHELLSSFRNAQRLNSEQVSAAEVGLVLPSERGSSGGKGRGTRTDLLHAKVAGLQTQVEGWSGALEAAMGVLENPKAAYAAASAEEKMVEPEEPHELKEGVTRESRAEAAHPIESIISEGATSSSADANASVPTSDGDAEGQEFEDDDPWNDLS